MNSACTFGAWHPLAAEKLMTYDMNTANDFSTFQNGVIRIRKPTNNGCNWYDFNLFLHSIQFNSIHFFFLHILYKSEWENNKSLSMHIKKLSHTREKWKENQTHHQMSMNTEYICIKSEKISNKPTNWFNWSHHYNFKYKRYWFQQFQSIKCKWNSIGCLCCVWQWVKLAIIITITIKK